MHTCTNTFTYKIKQYLRGHKSTLSINIAGALTLGCSFYCSLVTLSINIAGWSLQMLGYLHTHAHTHAHTYLHKHLQTASVPWPTSNILKTLTLFAVMTQSSYEAVNPLHLVYSTTTDRLLATKSLIFSEFINNVMPRSLYIDLMYNMRVRCHSSFKGNGSKAFPHPITHVFEAFYDHR